MSEMSLTLVLQKKTKQLKFINDMAKVQQKYEKITPFGGINFVMDKFDGLLGSEIDSHLGLRALPGATSTARSSVPSSVYSYVAAAVWKTSVSS